MSTHSSWPGSGAAGIFTGIFDDGEPTKKFTSEECLTELVDHIKNDPTIISNQVNLVGDAEIQEYRGLIPEATNPDAWYRVSTHRPTTDEEGNNLCGTDREVRTYENDSWADKGHSLEAKVITERGELHSIGVVLKW